MNYGIQRYEFEKKININKVLITLITIVFIIVIGIFCVICFKSSKNKELETKEDTIQTATQDVDTKNIAYKNPTIEMKNSINEKMKSKNRLPDMNQENIQKIKDIYKQGDSEHKRAYLTFDDGPSKKITPQILDILKENNIKATFFVLGSNVKSNQELIKREYEEGHYIANHGYTHEYSKIYAKTETVLQEYNDTEDEIRKALEIPEYSSGLFRFPGGSSGGRYADLKNEAKELLKENNVAYLDWNALTSDAVAGTDKAQMIKDLKDTVEGNDCVVILMHDAANKQDTADLLPEIIQYLRDEGYEFKNIYDIMDNNI